MDISLLLELPAWLEDECELDILTLTKDIPDTSAPPFLVIHSAGDKSKDTQPGSPQPGIASQSGRGASVVSMQIESRNNQTTYYLLVNIFLGLIITTCNCKLVSKSKFKQDLIAPVPC